MKYNRLSAKRVQAISQMILSALSKKPTQSQTNVSLFNIINKKAVVSLSGINDAWVILMEGGLVIVGRGDLGQSFQLTEKGLKEAVDLIQKTDPTT